MGCDIHMYVQKKFRDKWIHVGNAIDVGRDYNFFDLINNVRGNTYFSMAQQVPADIEIKYADLYEDFKLPSAFGEDTKARCELPYGDDDHIYIGEHSFCILTISDVMMYRHHNKIKDAYTNKCLYKVLRHMLKWANGKPETVRCVIGFDS